MDQFITLARVAEIEPGSARFVRAGSMGIAVFNSGGAFYATQDHCPGDGGSLSEGRLRGTEVECPADRARFYLATGECTHPATFRTLDTFRVWIDGGAVKIHLNELVRMGEWEKREPDEMLAPLGDA